MLDQLLQHVEVLGDRKGFSRIVRSNVGRGVAVGGQIQGVQLMLNGGFQSRGGLEEAQEEGPPVS